MALLLNSTPAALWQSIIHDAENACEINLNDQVESYLVFLLVRYTNKPDLIKHVIATDFLRGAKLPPQQRSMELQNVGDKCLLFSGLFPHIAEKRLVKISYFVNLGQTAYDAISHDAKDLYSELSNQFVSMMDILQSVRKYTSQNPDLLPLEAYDLWNESGSKRAFSVLKQYTKDPKSIPVFKR